MKSLVVSVCITAVTDMAAVSLLVFFWCSSGVLLGSSGVLRRETAAAMSVTAVIQTETTSDFI